MTAIIAITANGARIGAMLKKALPESTLFVIERHAAGEAESFSGGVQPLVERIWKECRAFVFIMATGIVVRTIAPLLERKDVDPAVVVLDDRGRFAISLLSGHLGGANDLANRCANVVGSTSVITTATDVNHLPSFDMLAKEKGWLIEDLTRVKVLNALLLEGKEIAVVDHRDEVSSYVAGKGCFSFYEDVVEAAASGAAGFLFVTNRFLPHDLVTDRTLLLRPLNLCLGIGCNRGTSSEEIESVVKENLERLGLSFKSVGIIATAEAKRDEEGLLEFASAAGIAVRFYSSEELNEIDVTSPPSDHALSAIGARGVAEPAALLASAGGKLLMPKVKQGNVTLAIAEASTIFL